MKKIIFIFVIIFLVSGCSLVQDQNVEKVGFVEDYLEFTAQAEDGMPQIKIGDEIVKVGDNFLSNVYEDNGEYFPYEIHNMLELDGLIYFSADGYDEERGSGTFFYKYDVNTDDLLELYFYKYPESMDEWPSLMAIDQVSDRLIIVVQSGGQICESLWLSQKDGFYSLDLGNVQDGLEKYSLPEWKILEEQESFPACVN